MDIIESMYERWSHGVGPGDDSWGDVTTEPAGVRFRDVDAGGVPALWAEPDGARDGTAILYLHGGGFVGGSLATHRKLAGHLARAAGVRTLLAHYRLAPEHPYPAQIEDALTAYRWVRDLDLEVVPAGDSSGGNLAIQVALREPAVALMLISPWTDLELTGGSYESNARHDLVFTREMVSGLVKMYLAGGGQEIDALRADLGGLPPTFVQAGGHEALLDDSLMFAERARASGVDVRLDVFDGQLHTFQMAAGNLPVADEAIGRFGAWLRQTL